MRWALVFLMPMLSVFGANILPHLKYIEPLSQKQQIEHIDCIYLINLDSRPEKLRLCMRELGRYQIVPYRFSAVIGKELSEDTIQDVGMKYKEGMMLCEGKFTLGPAARAFFHERMYGKVCFYRDFTKGALGCTLSHLSILQHAYESGYNTIWVMEDDVIVQKDPRILS